MSNRAIDKIGPAHELRSDQKHLASILKPFISKHYIFGGKHAVFVIYGDAGTGKSVVLSDLFFLLQSDTTHKHSALYKMHNYFLVNHPELLKVYRNIAGKKIKDYRKKWGGRFPIYKKNFQRPTSFINQMHKHHTHADVTFVDEAHLLLSEPDHYNNFYQHNQLAEIAKLSQVTVIVFDPHQVLRTKSYWDVPMLKKVLKPFDTASYTLKHQFRMDASDELIDWIDDFSDGKLSPIPARWSGHQKHYDFRVFDNCEAMRKAIVKRDHQCKLCRIVSTSGYPSTLDGGKHYIHETGGFKLPWDQYNHSQTPYAEMPQTLNEVGSMFTCQGFDMNYVGVILGPPVYLKPGTHQICIDLSKYTDTESLKKRKDIKDKKHFYHIKCQLVLNSVNVLMKRGIRGLYIYAHDPLLRKTLMKMYKQAIARRNA